MGVAEGRSGWKHYSWPVGRGHTAEEEASTVWQLDSLRVTSSDGGGGRWVPLPKTSPPRPECSSVPITHRPEKRKLEVCGIGFPV